MKCRFCDHENPAGVDRCQKCGAWIEQAVPSESTKQEPGDGEEENSRLATGSFEGQILGLMKGQKKIEAIKLYRSQTGSGLKEAKDAVEALAAKHGISPKGAGCAGMVLLLAIVYTIVGVSIWAVSG
jgi:ribosomal protein L7/L12